MTRFGRSFLSSAVIPSIFGVLYVQSSPHSGLTQAKPWHRNTDRGADPSSAMTKTAVRKKKKITSLVQPFQVFWSFLCINLQLFLPFLMHIEDSVDATALYQCPQTCKWLYADPSISFITHTVQPAFSVSQWRPHKDWCSKKTPLKEKKKTKQKDFKDA